MRTTRLLPVSPSMHCSRGGVPAQGGAPAQVLPPCEQNDRQVQKYYLAQTSFAGGKNWTEMWGGASKILLCRSATTLEVRILREWLNL